MLDALFKRAAKSLLAVTGEEALFRGATQTRINIERDVQFEGYGDTAQYKGDLTVAHDVATVSAELTPKTGDTFVMVAANETYRLEKRVENNGFNPRYIVLKVPNAVV